MAVSPYLPTPGFASWRRFKSRAITCLLVFCALAVIAPLFLVIYFLVAHGASSLGSVLVFLTRCSTVTRLPLAAS